MTESERKNAILYIWDWYDKSDVDTRAAFKAFIRENSRAPLNNLAAALDEVDKRYKPQIAALTAETGGGDNLLDITY